MGEVEAAPSGEQELARRAGAGVVYDDPQARPGDRLGRHQARWARPDHDHRLYRARFVRRHAVRLFFAKSGS